MPQYKKPQSAVALIADWHPALDPPRRKPIWRLLCRERLLVPGVYLRCLLVKRPCSEFHWGVGLCFGCLVHMSEACGTAAAIPSGWVSLNRVFGNRGFRVT